MKVAFYAPLKHPDHAVPSGDRQLARAFVQAMRQRGHVVEIASRFRSLDLAGDASRQRRLCALGARLAVRLVARYRRSAERPEVWFTYHLYHKAPDWLGPAVSRALGIPYVVAEASVAARQRDGPWATGYAASVAAVAAADAVVLVNPADVEGVRGVRGEAGPDEVLAPFVDLSRFTAPTTTRAVHATPAASVRCIVVAMMRPGAKLASYRLLADALARIPSPAWHLVAVGDGPARADVEAAFAGLDPRRIRFAGAQSAERVALLLRESDLFLWPAIDEAFGVAFLEAQACGLPVVGGEGGGVGAVVANGRTGVLVPLGDAGAFASAVLRLLVDGETRRRMGSEAALYVRARHDLSVAAERIDALLRRVAAKRPAPLADATPRAAAP